MSRRPVRLDPEVLTLTATLAAGILAGPAGGQIVTDGNLAAFFAQVLQWYGDDPTQTSPYTSSRFVDDVDCRGDIVAGNAPPASAFDLQRVEPDALHESFNVYVNYSNDFNMDDITDSSNPENPNDVPVQPPDFSPFFNDGQRDRARPN